VSKALYRKYRSKTLSEVVGQKHVTDILTRSLAQGRIAHAYLLTGPKGVGKTSIARILAHEINKLPYSDDSAHLDIIEIDAASNNGVEDIRDLREKVQIAPVSADKKIYIIDEVHMLSKAAFNALLKTLEEPPEHAVFILATTDVDKLPATIISRTQQFSFRAISSSDAVQHLKFIAEQEKITINDSALELIALRGDGSFRDSISLLDQLQGLADEKTGITKELVEQALGLAPSELVHQLLDAHEAKDLSKIVSLLDDSEQSGIQTVVLCSQLIQAIRMNISKKPHLIPLLDQLLDVAKSSQPNIRLLTALASHITPKPRSVALSAVMPEVSAPIAELEKRATTAPIKRQVNTTTDTPRTKLTPVTAEKLPEVAYEAGTLDWAALIEYTRQNFVAVYSVLSKCSGEIEGDTLVLYTNNSFYKKKLDDAKHRGNLLTALKATGAGAPIIKTVGTPPPPKDSVAASVAAIMGGGEEVSVD
jgi:DNA polymerase-3 subunit gamma/tau